MWFIISSALAQHVDIDDVAVLTAADLPWVATSVGHPAIWEEDGGVSMVFESEVTEPGCSVAYALGRATSTDGLTWSVSSTSYGPSLSAPCGYRAPVVADTSDGLFLFVHRVHDDTAWARQWTGHGKVSWAVPSLDGLEPFSVARRDGTWFGVGVDPAVGLVALSSDDAVTWTVDSTVLVYGDTWWSLDGLVSPALSCFDGPSLPWTLHFGGWTGADYGYGYGFSDDFGLWFFSLTPILWTSVDAWAAWDAIVSPSAAWVAFEHEGAIGWATTAGGMPVGAATRDCSSAP